MNALQIKNILTPIVGIIVAWLARKVPFIDAATWSTIIDSVVTAVVAGVLGWLNRGSAVITAAANEPAVKKIVLEPTAPSALVDQTPDNVSKS